MAAAERAAWNGKAAAAGVPPSNLLRRAMAATRVRTAPAGFEREHNVQVARTDNNLNQLARCANTHTPAAKAVTVIANLVAFERSWRAVARLAGESDAHSLRRGRRRLHPRRNRRPAGPQSAQSDSPAMACQLRASTPRPDGSWFSFLP